MRCILVSLLLVSTLAASGCQDEAITARTGVHVAAETEVDDAWLTCADRADAIALAPSVPGVPSYDENRIEHLGRSRGEPVLFVRGPAPSDRELLSPTQRVAAARFDEARAGHRVVQLKANMKRDPAGLRAIVLSEGYALFDDPVDGHWFSRWMTLTDLFDEDTIYLQRGDETFELTRRGGNKYPFYAHASGRYEGEKEVVLARDRIAVTREELAEPLHRDIAAFARRERVDRVDVVHHAEQALLVTLRRDEEPYQAVLAVDGAQLTLECLVEPSDRRLAYEQGRDARAERADALARISLAIDAFVSERPTFDRPRGVEGPDRDGELRPYWMSAYLGGRHGYEVEDEVYPVYLADGRPNPPQVCVDFVLNIYERASGTWFTPRGEKPERQVGTLDFNAFEIENRRGVLGLGKFAEEAPDVFDYERFADEIRVPFAKRDAFFSFVMEHARLAPGDIVTIQGLKPDGRVHQHAIYVEHVDPISGFPYGLADKLGPSYRGTWEDVMAEAPKRSILYRARPTARLWDHLAPPAR